MAILYGIGRRTVREVYGVFESMYAANPGPESARLAADTLEAMGDVRAAAVWRKRAKRASGAASRPRRAS